MCPPHEGGVLGCDVMRGGGLIFFVAVCQEGTVLEEWGLVSWVVGRMQI